MFCTETQTFIESFTHTTTNTFNVYILSQPYAWMYTYKTLNLHASWSYLSYLEGTSNAAAFQLNSFSRVFEPSNTQHRKSTSLSSCAWFKTWASCISTWLFLQCQETFVNMYNYYYIIYIYTHQPVLLYACEIWGVLKHIFELKSSTPDR